MIDILHGDMREVLQSIPKNSIDAVVTDPPYCLDSIRKRFSSPTAKPAGSGKRGEFGRLQRGFMGQTWDNDIAMQSETWAEVFRVLKPGAHGFVFGGTRTFHRIAVALEDAGFELRDTLMWLFGCGFPKSYDVAKGIQSKRKFNKARFDNRDDDGGDVAIPGKQWVESCALTGGIWTGKNMEITDPVAQQWGGWGSAIKPAYEPILLIRKPLDRTIVDTVLKYGTGALNIDKCRVPTNGEKLGGGMLTSGRPTLDKEHNIGWDRPWMHDPEQCEKMREQMLEKTAKAESLGRWPANILLDDSFSEPWSRYFYSTKANRADRAGSKHPTVKPVSLMRWLCRLITPPDGTVLDPFAGSGTTGAATYHEGFNAILVEQSEEYVADIRRRIEMLQSADKFISI